MIQEEASQLEKQIEIIDQQANELMQISKSLEDLWKKEETPEFLANLGKGIFVKSKAIEKELFVNIGKGVVIKKTPKETVEIIKNQLRKVSETREEFIVRINELQCEMQNIIQEAEKNEHECKCEKGEKCEDKECKCKSKE